MRSKNRNFICIEELCFLQIISLHKIYQQILKSLIEDESMVSLRRHAAEENRQRMPETQRWQGFDVNLKFAKIIFRWYAKRRHSCGARTKVSRPSASYKIVKAQTSQR